MSNAKKYEFTGETKNHFGKILRRIRALVDVRYDVCAGDIGGWIEKESNLTNDINDYAWVYDDALVCGGAKVYGDAKVYGSALVCGDAQVYGSALVCGDAQVYGSALVYGSAEVCGDAWVWKREHLFTITNIGSRNATTTFFHTQDGGVKVKCGCFLGTIDEFLAKVDHTHEGTKHQRTYHAAVELAKIQMEL